MTEEAPAADRPAKTPLLDVRDLAVRYGRAVEALRGVSLEVAEGGIVAVLGNNGAGKSTLLRTISGTCRLSGAVVERGAVTFAGRKLIGVDPGRIVGSGVVQVPEGRRIFGRLTVEENLRAGAMRQPDRVKRANSRDRVFELFPVLAQRRRQRAGLLSGGEQQMLAIGRGLMASPRLLLLDEPSLGLAPLIVGQIADVIAEINQQGTSVLLVEQNAEMALDLATFAYVLELGQVSLSGTVDELRRTDQVKRLYLGGGAPELDTGDHDRPTLGRWADTRSGPRGGLGIGSRRKVG
ncbi:MAG: branched-chain amino acid transport system ATP-binding protein [Pseudonocardiales bacterium]|jgi:ABC-type branched-subunit amino acid transport system ATPase component|nr:branched-chain amino acid transport system ATP-binding protein [Pseudonocardiales bacterium]MDT4927988.1 branched-chain amino acid transport system ATP-binding protein [Pseudonocardiales bacterium]